MKIAAGILVLVVVLVGAYLFFGAQTPAESLTYTNTAYGITFQYPDTYALQEREAGNGERYHYSITLIDKEALANIPQDGEGPPAINVDIYQNNLDQLSIETWVRGTNFSNFKLSPDGLVTSTSIAGVPALSYTWDGLYRGKSIVFEHKANIIMVSGQYMNQEDQIVKDFDTVVASFTLN